ncbi:unnamed protein product [Trichobilharzia regenti]|nr:unnamed protein product [Trichobilharzia regenti]
MLGTNRQYVLDDKHFNMSTTPTTATATQNWTNCDMNSMNIVPAYNAYNQYTLQALNSHTSINTPVTGINTMTSTKSVEILTNTSSTQLGGPAYFFINTTTTNNNNNNNSNNSYQSNYDPLASDNIPNNRQIHLPSIQSNRDILLCNPACTYTSPSENINDNLSIDDTPKKSVPFLPPLTVSHHHHHHHNPRNSINDEQCKKNAYKMYKNVYEDSDAANGSTNGIDYLPSINPDSCYLLNYGQPNQMGVMMQSDQVEQCPSLSTCGTELNSLSENNHSNNTNTTTNNHNNNNNTVENTIHRNPSNENPTQHTQRHLWDIKDMKLPKVRKRENLSVVILYLSIRFCDKWLQAKFNNSLLGGRLTGGTCHSIINEILPPITH